jgi:hypothetical protein
MGALLANLRHSLTQANDAVDLFSGPLGLFVLLLLFSSVLAVLLVPYLLLVTLGLLTLLAHWVPEEHASYGVPSTALRAFTRP